MPRSTALELSVRFPVPVDRAWSAVTEPTELARWWPGATLNAAPDGAVKFTVQRPPSARHRAVTGRVTRRAAPDLLELRIRSKPRGRKSTVTLEFSQLADGARLRVTQLGGTERKLDGILVSEARDDWRRVLAALQRHLEAASEPPATTR